MTLFLGIDASTTAVKALVFDEVGNVVAEGRSPLELSNPSPDAWEQDASTWWSALCEAVESATAQLGPEHAQTIGALAIAHQRETFVACDDRGEPLAPALVWMDARCRQEVDDVTSELDADHIHSVSGKVPCTTPSLYKIRFLLERSRPDLAERAAILDVHAFLVERLTGERVTSLASADPLGLVDMKARAWSDELVELSGASRDRLPRLVEAGTAIGRLLPAVAERLRLSSNLVVVAGAGDGQAAGLGAGITRSSVAYLNAGTAIVTGVLSREYRVDRAFRTLYGGLPDTFFLESDLKGGTFTIDWLVGRMLGSGSSVSEKAARILELERAAADIPPGSGGLIFVPYLLGVMNPFWDDDAAAIAIGLRGDHSPAHLYRACIEGLAFESRLALEHIERASSPIDQVRVMGGATRSDFAMGIFADVIDAPLVRCATSEATALGAAILARSAIDDTPIVELAASMCPVGEVIEPLGHRTIYRRLYEEVYRGLFESVRDRMERLTALTRKD